MTVRGSEVRVGTVLVFLGTARTITAIEDYESPVGPARIVYSGAEWHMTVFDEQDVEVIAR